MYLKALVYLIILKFLSILIKFNRVSNMDDELSIYQDEETRERARQLLLLDSE